MDVLTFLHQAFGDGEEDIYFPPPERQAYKVLARIHNSELGADEEFEVEHVNWEHDNKLLILRLG